MHVYYAPPRNAATYLAHGIPFIASRKFRIACACDPSAAMDMQRRRGNNFRLLAIRLRLENQPIVMITRNNIVFILASTVLPEQIRYALTRGSILSIASVLDRHADASEDTAPVYRRIASVVRRITDLQYGRTYENVLLSYTHSLVKDNWKRSPVHRLARQNAADIIRLEMDQWGGTTIPEPDQEGGTHI